MFCVRGHIHVDSIRRAAHWCCLFVCPLGLLLVLLLLVLLLLVLLLLVLLLLLIVVLLLPGIGIFARVDTYM